MTNSKNPSPAYRRFVIQYELIDGECEYARCQLETSQGKYTEKDFVRAWVYEDDFKKEYRRFKEDGYFQLDGGMRAIKDVMISEVSEAEYQILSRYL